MPAGRSRLLLPLMLLLCIGMPACAAGLIDINTVDEAGLETLPGIGATKAAAIIAYRTAHGPFGAPQDLERVSGIGTATYAKIAGLITVAQAPTGSTPVTASSSESAPKASGSVRTYIPPPSELSVRTGGDQAAFLDVPTIFTAQACTSGGSTDPSATLYWSFGDGSTGEGTRVQKTFHSPGAYEVTAYAKDGSASAETTFTVTVTCAAVRIAAETGAGVAIANDATSTLDLSGWRLSAGTGTFRIPDRTRILPGTTVLFPTSVTGLPVAFDTRLSYPDGLLAAAYEPNPAASVRTDPASGTALVQPQASAARSYREQTADSAAISTVSEKGTAHAAQAVSAPVAATTVAAAGALLSARSSSTPAAAVESRTGLSSSPWAYGFLGLLGVAAGALVLF